MSTHDHASHDHEHGRDDCVEYIERIVYFIDNELDQADCAVVEMHLRECGPCLQRRSQRAVVARHDAHLDALVPAVRALPGALRPPARGQAAGGALLFGSGARVPA